MEELTLRKAQILAKTIYVRLNEVMDVSKQLAEALDRNDDVTARMLIGMRSDPIHRASEAKAALTALCSDLPPQDAQRLTALLNGAPPQSTGEQALAAQLSSNEKLLKQVLVLDESLNLKVAREKSVYQKKRTSAR